MNLRTFFEIKKLKKKYSKLSYIFYECFTKNKYGHINTASKLEM